MGERALSFRDLKVYQAARDLQQKIFELTKTFPSEEKYSLTDQVRRSSRSVGANIAEAWHKRRYVAHFTSKLSDADGEQAETQHWVDTALLCKYVEASLHAELMTQSKDIGRMLGKMIKDADSWCEER
jgi:four helix bundle protein